MKEFIKENIIILSVILVVIIIFIILFLIIIYFKKNTLNKKDENKEVSNPDKYKNITDCDLLKKDLNLLDKEEMCDILNKNKNIQTTCRKDFLPLCTVNYGSDGSEMDPDDTPENIAKDIIVSGELDNEEEEEQKEKEKQLTSINKVGESCNTSAIFKKCFGEELNVDPENYGTSVTV